MSEDEVGTPPNYTVGVGVQDLPTTIKGPGTRLITRTRPAGRIPQREE